MSLHNTILDQFDKSMKNAGFADRSKAIQSSLYEFIYNNEWKENENGNKKKTRNHVLEKVVNKNSFRRQQFTGFIRLNSLAAKAKNTAWVVGLKGGKYSFLLCLY